jgi:hypothetical protein
VDRLSVAQQQPIHGAALLLKQQCVCLPDVQQQSQCCCHSSTCASIKAIHSAIIAFVIATTHCTCMRSMQCTRVHLMMAARSTPMPVIHRLQQEVLPQSFRVVCLLQCRSTLTERPMQACTWCRYVSAIGTTSHCTACIQCVCHASVCARGVHEVCLY